MTWWSLENVRTKRVDVVVVSCFFFRLFFFCHTSYLNRMCRWKYTSGKSVFSISIPATILFIPVLYPPPPPTPLDTMKQKQKQKQKGVVSIEKRKTLICLFVCFIHAIDWSIWILLLLLLLLLLFFSFQFFFCFVKFKIFS